MRKFLGPNAELAPWVLEALRWSKYLDAHAERARYPRMTDLETYSKQTLAVEQNLVNHADRIRELSLQFAPVVSAMKW